MNWFRKSAVGEPEAPTPEDLLAEVEQECAFAEAGFDMAVGRLRGYNVEHQQMPISYTVGEVTRIVTMVNDWERRRLEGDVRMSLDRRNKALAARAELLKRMGKIR